MHRRSPKQQAPPPPPSPSLARRSTNRKSTIRSGRTIAASREKLETANERALARQKVKKRATRRIFTVSTVFLLMLGILIWLFLVFLNEEEQGIIELSTAGNTFLAPTAPIIDEDASVANSEITTRMSEYIALAESDFADLGYQVEKSVLPANSIREVDFYLKDHSGYIKTIVDRGSAVTVEDADRMLRYLAEQGIDTFQYIDVRIKGKAFYLP